MRCLRVLQQMSDARHQLARELKFRAGVSGNWPWSSNRIRVFSSPPNPSWIRLPAISGIFLARRFFLGVFGEILTLCGKTHA